MGLLLVTWIQRKQGQCHILSVEKDINRYSGQQQEKQPQEWDIIEEFKQKCDTGSELGGGQCD